MKRLLIPDELLSLKKNDLIRSEDHQREAKAKERTGVSARETTERSPDGSRDMYSFASSPESLIDFYESIIDDLYTLKVAVKASYEDIIQKQGTERQQDIEFRRQEQWAKVLKQQAVVKEFEYQLSIIEYELQEAKLQNKGYVDVEFIGNQLKTNEKEVREQ